jgi:anti-sigma regulatory factor (Ser/Thr protein kinase)
LVDICSQKVYNTITKSFKYIFIEGDFMPNQRTRSEEIRQFLVDHLDQHTHNLVSMTARTFQISRQAVSKHLQHLERQGLIERQGQTRRRTYRLRPLVQWQRVYALDTPLHEDAVWRQDIAPLLEPLPPHILAIWQYGFSEMLNNAIEHSSGHQVTVHVRKTARDAAIAIVDDGVGIFKKIQHALGLAEEPYAVLELAKGKLTTEPAHHTGEGIFFTARLFDQFTIDSGDVFFTLNADRPPVIFPMTGSASRAGTLVFLQLPHQTSRTLKEVFEQFAGDEDFAFAKTVVPVHFAIIDDEALLSRSQARRVVARVDRFRMVTLDFTGVELIGQAFADEIFRVFRHEHPDIEVTALHANPAVQQMIRRAEHHAAP